MPTLRPSDLTMDNISPRPRYRALNDAIIGLSGTHHLRIQGTDELVTRDDSIMYERQYHQLPSGITRWLPMT